MNTGPNNHNKPYPTPEQDYSDLEREEKEEIQKILHVPMSAETISAVIEMMHKANKMTTGRSLDTDYTEALQDKIKPFLNTDGVEPDKLIIFNDLRKVTDPKTIAPRLTEDQLKVMSQNTGKMFADMIRTTPKLMYLVDNLDSETMLPGAGAQRNKAGQPQPYKTHRVQGGVRTWLPDQLADPAHEQNRKNEIFVQKLVSTPLPIETMARLIDAVAVDMDSGKTPTAASSYIKSMQEKLASLGGAEDGEHVDFSTLARDANKPRENTRPKEYSKKTIDDVHDRFTEQFENFAEIDTDLEEIQKNIDDYTVDPSTNPYDETGPYLVFGKDGRWVPEERDDAIVWISKEQKQQNELLEREADRIHTRRDLGFLAAKSVGVMKSFGKAKNRLLFRNMRKKHHEKRQEKLNRLILDQQNRVNDTRHKEVRKKRQEKLDELTAKRDDAADKLTGIHTKIESNEDTEKIKSKWIERGAKASGRKALRQYGRELRQDAGYNRQEVRLVKKSITKEQKITLGQIRLRKHATEANRASQSHTTENLQNRYDEFKEYQTNLINRRKHLEASATEAEERIERLNDDLIAISFAQPMTDELQEEIAKTQRLKSEAQEYIITIDNEREAIRRRLNSLEGEIGDLEENLREQERKQRKTDKIADEKIAYYKQLEDDWKESVEQRAS